MKMCSLIVIYYVLCGLGIVLVNCKISDKRLCANKDCTEPISEGKTILGYGSIDSKILSFASNKKVTIYSKSAGTNTDLWGAEIDGKRGYIPKSHVKESKMYHKSLDFLLDTEVGDAAQVPTSDKETKENLSPDPVQQPYEVVDGTTLYLNPEVTTELPVENVVSPDYELPTETLNEQIVAAKTEAVSADDTLKAEPLIADKVEIQPEIIKDLPLSSGLGIQDNVEKSIGDKAKESMVDNVLSSITDWMNENDTGAQSRQEEDDEEDEEGEVDDDDDEEELEDDNETEGNENNEKLVNKVEIAENHQEKPNTLSNVNMPEHGEIKTAESENDLKINETLEGNSENLQADLKKSLEADIKGVPFINMAMKEADVHAQHIKEETLNEIPPPLELTTQENTPEEGISTEKIIVENIHIENAIDLEKVPHGNDKVEEEQINNSVKEETQTNENAQEKPAETVLQFEETFVEPQDVLITLEGRNETETHSASLEDAGHLPKAEESVNTETLEVGIETAPTTSQAPNPFKTFEDLPREESDTNEETKTEENADVKEVFEEKTDEMDLEDENNMETADNSGIFSGLYSSMFGSKETEETTSGDNEKEEDGQCVTEKNTAEIANTEETKPVEEEIKQATARDILWGTSIKKEYDEKVDKPDSDALLSRRTGDESSCQADPSLADCLLQHKQSPDQNIALQDSEGFVMELPRITYDVLIVLVMVAVTVIIFLWGYMYIEKLRKEAPLIGKINNLEKEYMVIEKEKEDLEEKIRTCQYECAVEVDGVKSAYDVHYQEELNAAESLRESLEEQIENLEKELENSTEVGLELNRMLQELLSSENGSETLIANVEKLQRQLVEQQQVISSYNDNLNVKETENHEMRLELEISHSKVADLKGELNEMALNLIKIEEDKEQIQSNFEAEINSLKEQLENNKRQFEGETKNSLEKINNLNHLYEDTKRNLELKTNEFMLLKENINEIENIKNNKESIKSLFDVSATKAEVIQLRNERELLKQQLEQTNDFRRLLEKETENARRDLENLKTKFDDVDREKLEAETKLQVLSNYFKDREAQLQKELNKHESMWVAKQGEASSTTERIRYMQEELQNSKVQNESLKQEIIAQEVQMKSQISILEKKAHENWVNARQVERKLEDAKQESAQLRNRLTLRERNMNDDKSMNRLQSPLEQNGDIQISPMHMTNESVVSPPLLYGTHDHLTTSPPLSGLPPFLPPPPGVPFMPPPLGGVPMPLPGFLPPPPSMIPGDHRPPPLGRMSSPPLNSRYSPDNRAYSPYSRNSPSPTSDEDYDRASPRHHMYRAYSPYNGRDDRRDFRPPPPMRTIHRNNDKGVRPSSGSANSNESLEKINRHNSKV